MRPWYLDEFGDDSRVAKEPLREHRRALPVEKAGDAEKRAKCPPRPFAPQSLAPPHVQPPWHRVGARQCHPRDGHTTELCPDEEKSKCHTFVRLEEEQDAREREQLVQAERAHFECAPPSCPLLEKTSGWEADIEFALWAITLLNELGVQYWVTHGMLFVIMRWGDSVINLEGKTIWTSDLDIDLYVIDLPVEAVSASCVEHGYEWDARRRRCALDARRKRPGICVIDFQRAEITEDGVWHSFSPNYVLPKHWILPTRTGLLHGVEVQVPRDPLRVISHTIPYHEPHSWRGEYGMGCMSAAYPGFLFLRERDYLNRNPQLRTDLCGGYDTLRRYERYLHQCAEWLDYHGYASFYECFK